MCLPGNGLIHMLNSVEFAILASPSVMPRQTSAVSLLPLSPLRASTIPCSPCKSMQSIFCRLSVPSFTAECQTGGNERPLLQPLITDSRWLLAAKEGPQMCSKMPPTLSLLPILHLTYCLFWVHLSIHRVPNVRDLPPLVG